MCPVSLFVIWNGFILYKQKQLLFFEPFAVHTFHLHVMWNLQEFYCVFPVSVIEFMYNQKAEIATLGVHENLFCLMRFDSLEQLDCNRWKQTPHYQIYLQNNTIHNTQHKLEQKCFPVLSECMWFLLHSIWNSLPPEDFIWEIWPSNWLHARKVLTTCRIYKCL